MEVMKQTGAILLKLMHTSDYYRYTDTFQNRDIGTNTDTDTNTNTSISTSLISRLTFFINYVAQSLFY